MASSISSLVLRALDVEKLRTHQQSHCCGDNDEGRRLQEERDEADSRAVPTMMLGTELINVSKPPMLVSRPSMSRKPSSLSERPSRESDTSRQRADNDHRRDVVQHRREHDGHHAVEPQQLHGVAAGCLGQLDGDPREETGLRAVTSTKMLEPRMMAITPQSMAGM